jgi:M6 family metalloprotease-like protein
VTASEGIGYSTAGSSYSDYRVSNGYSTLDGLSSGTMNSIGTVKLLVVPIYFRATSSTSSSGTDTTNKPTSEELSIINKAYFGEKSDTGWESLKSYYSTSSYGKITISGTVSSPLCVNATAAEFASAAGDNYASYTASLAQNAVTTLANSTDSSVKIDPSDYDNNGDGYVDGVELIYFTDQKLANAGGSDLWWAYTSTTSKSANTTTPVAKRYFWSPYSMLADGYYTPDIDTHTLVHETGHMLGLNDYYSYDKTKNSEGKSVYSEGPAGMVDMMDFNIGDHDAYSKMILGWVKPKVIDGSSSDFNLTLSSFTDSGDCVILRDTKTDKWNGTPYDEYLLLQYYTPTGLNEQDSAGYKEWSKYGTGGCYKTAGLQVFHIDSRLYEQYGSYNTQTGNAITANYKYTDTPIKTADISDTTKGTYAMTGIAADNTGSNSIEINDGVVETSSANRLISALPADETNKFKTTDYESHLGEMSTLFGAGSSYGGDYYSQYAMGSLYPNGNTFNDGSSLNWNFQVVSNDSTSCTIHFVEDN